MSAKIEKTKKIINVMQQYEIVLKSGDKVYVNAQYCQPDKDRALLFGIDDMRPDHPTNMILVAVFQNDLWSYINTVNKA